MKKNKNNKLTKILVGILSILILALAGIFLGNKWVIKFYYTGGKEVHAQFGLPYQDPGVEAEYTGTLLRFVKKPVNVTIDSSSVDLQNFGKYTVTYSAKYKDISATSKRKVIVEDTIGPDIQLLSSPDAYTVYNHPYEEEGFTAIDNYDGDVTSQVTSKESNGMVYYSVTDSHGNTSTARRKIVYDDRKGPEFNFEDGSEVVVYNGEEFKDDYTAIDDCDGDVTSKVIVEGNVDTSQNGEYELKYSVTDTHGNTTNITRKVKVENKPVNEETATEDNKTIYLTFDDGPYKYTDHLLDILDKYNVKATFFVTNAYPGYAYCIQEEAQRGHTVAVHTASHNYASIYASSSAYWNDFNSMNNIIQQQTGSKTTMFRFPGGSSNTVSKNYCTGVVTQIANEAKAMGYTYYDWNVSSGDAGATTDTDVVYNNVIDGISTNSKYGHPSVVLQHDVKEFSVNAVEHIIQWGLENGYSFKALHPGCYTAHHPISN